MKILMTAMTCFLFRCPALAEVTHTNQTITQTVIENGVGLGAVIAVVISWSIYRFVVLAILHGIFGWFYVVYYEFTRKQHEEN